MASKYFIKKGDQTSGPMSYSDVRNQAQSGNLTPNDWVWKEGSATRGPAKLVKGLSFKSQPVVAPGSAQEFPKVELVEETKPSNDLPIFECVNCGKPIPWTRSKKLFCSKYCAEGSTLIRWIRSTIKRGNFYNEDIKQAREKKIGWMCLGGYSSLDRYLPKEKRNLVKERYANKCAICGEDGREIDHISGSSDSMENLRLLCTKCHNKKHDFNLATDDGRKKFNLSPKVREGLGKVYKNIMLHALSEEPLKPCYDDIEWDELHLKIIRNRRVEFNQFVFPHIRQFVEQKLSRTKIARELNEIGLPTFAGRGKWSYKSVQQILDDNNVTD